MGARVTTAKAVVYSGVRRPVGGQAVCRAGCRGVVGDGDGCAGRVLPGTVTVLGPRSPDVKVVTDEKGLRVLALQPGACRVRVELRGFKAWQTTVTVVSGRTTTIAVVLDVGALADTVNVTSGATSVQTSRSCGSARRAAATRGWRPASIAKRTSPAERVPPRNAHPRSTFSTDVDTASYTNVRRMLREGRLPPEGAVRIEEFVNYFRFDYAAPAGTRRSRSRPRSAPARGTSDTCWPWSACGPRTSQIASEERAGDAARGRNLVFLVDVSGSMASDDKLPLVRRSLHLLTDRLGPADRIALVVYAGRSGLALPSTSGEDKAAIHAAIDRLESGGSTNGGAGITLAYRLAREQFVRGGVNRVILATDGDFNVGVTSEDQLVRLIERERKSGVPHRARRRHGQPAGLDDGGAGRQGQRPLRLPRLARRGRKVLVREMDATLVTVAKDVKIQVEFNPRQVAAYRLIGYENRRLDDEDFNDDAKDAGEMGAGHTVTALYEIVPAGGRVPGRPVDPLKYQRQVVAADARREGELMTVALRYQRPEGGQVGASKPSSRPTRRRWARISASRRPSPSSACC